MLEPHKDLILDDKKDKSIEDKKELSKIENKINDTRYVDWMITTYYVACFNLSLSIQFW